MLTQTDLPLSGGGIGEVGVHDGRPHEPLPGSLRALDARSGRLLGRRRTGDRLVRAGDRIFDKDAGVYGRWFTGASCNTCYNAIDRHVERGRAQQPAIIYDSPVTQAKRVITYAALLHEVQTLAAMLQDFGVQKGDRVILYMPMVPEALFAMYACARIGAIHSVVFGGFAAKELATRIDDCKPKLILSASCGIEVARVVPYKPLLDAAIDLAQAKPDGLPDPAAPAMRGGAHAWPRP